MLFLFFSIFILLQQRSVIAEMPQPAPAMPDENHVIEKTMPDAGSIIDRSAATNKRFQINGKMTVSPTPLFSPMASPDK